MGWSPDDAQRVAMQLLADLPERVAHVRAVAATARDLAHRNALPDAVVSAAWLHDIGYAAPLVNTDLHALDGARHLASLGAPDNLVSLVAYHSGAGYEAAQRGLDEELARFQLPAERELDALTFADLTNGPTGAPVSVDDRLAEILARYPAGDPVHTAVQRAGNELRASAARAQALASRTDA